MGQRAKIAGKSDVLIVGAGPTGVEMAGQIGEIARDTLRRDFRTIDPAGAQIEQRRRPPARPAPQRRVQQQ